MQEPRFVGRVTRIYAMKEDLPSNGRTADTLAPPALRSAQLLRMPIAGTELGSEERRGGDRREAVRDCPAIDAVPRQEICGGPAVCQASGMIEATRSGRARGQRAGR